MASGEKLTVKLNDNDNVATALRNIEVGETTQNIKSLNKIPKGHKISLRKIGLFYACLANRFVLHRNKLMQ